MPLPSRRPTGRWAAALLAAAGLGCGEAVQRPAIGLTFNWSESPLERYVTNSVNAGVTHARDSIRIVTSRPGGLADYGVTPMAAEVTRASDLVADPSVLAVVGPGGSREVLQVAPIYNAAGLADVVPTATSRLLADAGPMLFRLAPDDSVQGHFIAAFADTALGAKSLAIFHVPDEYGVGLAAGTAATARANGQTVLLRTAIDLLHPCGDAAGDRYYAGLVTDLAQRGRPDAVVLAMRTQEAACLGYALRRRWPDIAIIGGDGLYVDTPLFALLRGTGEGIYLVAFWHPDAPWPAARAFVEEFRAATTRPPRHGDAVIVDGVRLVAQVIRNGARTRADVVSALRAVGVSTPAYEGITGTISFAAGAQRPLWMTQLRGDSSVLVRRP